jgi:ribosomal-protein-alanine N-acetyltransferase
LSQLIEIRHAREEDIPEILRIEQASDETPHWIEQTYRDMLRMQNGPAWREVWVGVAEGGMAGFAVVKVLLDEAEIESISVDREWRRHGVGRALLEAIEDSIRIAALNELRLEVRQSNETARRFYESLGFVANGTRRGYYSNPAEDAVLMCRAIG